MAATEVLAIAGCGFVALLLAMTRSDKVRSCVLHAVFHFFRSCRGNKAANDEMVALCMRCAQDAHDKAAAYRLIYDRTPSDKMLMCPECGCRHTKHATPEAPK